VSKIDSNSSWYSNILCETLNQYFDKMDFLSIDVKVRNILKNRHKILTSQSENTMKKLCYFFKKNLDEEIKYKRRRYEIPSSYLPNKIPNFSGRNDVLNQIKNAFNKDRKQIIILKSISGTGKSAIANKYGWDLNADLINVFWMKSDDLDNVETEYNDFSERFGIKIEKKSKQDIIKYTNDKIKNSKENFLFIFDNCEDIQHISSYILNMPNNANVLITTNKNLNIDDIKDNLFEIDLIPFSKIESENFIKESLNKRLKEDVMRCSPGAISNLYKLIL